MFACKVAPFRKVQLDKKLERINYRHIIPLTGYLLAKTIPVLLQKQWQI